MLESRATSNLLKQLNGWNRIYGGERNIFVGLHLSTNCLHHLTPPLPLLYLSPYDRSSFRTSLAHQLSTDPYLTTSSLSCLCQLSSFSTLSPSTGFGPKTCDTLSRVTKSNPAFFLSIKSLDKCFSTSTMCLS